MKRFLWTALLCTSAYAQNPTPKAPPSPVSPVRPERPERLRAWPDSDDSLYNRGTRALDANKWDEAAEAFTRAAERKNDRSDGALYWKAYSENKLGQRDAALA